MTKIETVAAIAPTLEPVEEEPEGVTGKKSLGFAAWLAIGWLGLVAFAVFAAPILPVHDPLDPVPGLRQVGPFQLGEHFLGGDGTGRDMLARIVYGARASMTVAVFAILFGFVIGGMLGLLSGYFRNWFSTALATMFDILLAFPSLVLALAMVAFLKGDPQNSEPILPITGILVLALGIVSIPILARITRASTLTWSQREFVLAAKAQGAKNSRIIFREVLPNVLPAMVSIALLGMAVALIAEGSLSILGAGIEAPTPSWGNIIALGRNDLRSAPHIVFIPSAAIFLTVLSLNFLGDRIRELFDVRESAL